jgi:hypothetical protein
MMRTLHLLMRTRDLRGKLLDFLVAAGDAALRGTAVPSRLPAHLEAVKAYT